MTIQRPAYLYADVSVLCNPWVTTTGMMEISAAIEQARVWFDLRLFVIQPEPISAAMRRADEVIGGERIIEHGLDPNHLFRRVLQHVGCLPADAKPQKVWILTDRVAPEARLKKVETDTLSKLSLHIDRPRGVRLLQQPIEEPLEDRDLIEVFADYARNLR